MIVFLIHSITIVLICLLVGSYVGYPLFLEFSKKSQRGSKVDFPYDSKIHLIIPCFNEESVIEKKIHNSFNIDYPREVFVYVIIDQSDDHTLAKAEELKDLYPNLIVWDKGYRKGKNDSINFFFGKVKPEKTDVVFFTDANTFYLKDSFMQLWEELILGAYAVGGSMKYLDMQSISAKSEGVYWRYEEWIRRNESKLGRCITMNGGNMAMIASVFEELPSFVPNDFDIPIRLVSKYKTAFSELAVGQELAIDSSAEELTRKKRMANRQMNAVLLRWTDFDFITKLQILFHKVIRWFALFLIVGIYALQGVNAIITGDLWFFFVLMSLAAFLAIVLVLDLLNFHRIPAIGLLAYAFKVHWFSGVGAFHAVFGKKVSVWGAAASNRQGLLS